MILYKGTLLNSKSQISTSTVKALREASARGVKIVIATGKVRYYRAMIFQDTMSYYYILANACQSSVAATSIYIT